MPAVLPAIGVAVDTLIACAKDSCRRWCTLRLLADILLHKVPALNQHAALACLAAGCNRFCELVLAQLVLSASMTLALGS